LKTNKAAKCRFNVSQLTATASITSEFEKVPAGREIKTFLALWAYPWFFVSFGGYILLGADYQARKYIVIVNTGTIERN